MDKIETDTHSHLLDERIDYIADADGKRLGRTECGRKVRGWTGATIAAGITCGACRRKLRARGYQV